jgi:ion channel
MPPARAPGETRRARARATLAGSNEFGLVLILVLVTIIILAGAEGPVGQMVGVALSGGTLLFVLNTAGANRRTFRASAVVVVAAVVGTAVTLLVGDSFGSTTARVVGLMLAVIAPLVILRRIVTSPTITFRLVLGALSIYLLLGLAYSYLFPLVATLTGQPFFVQTSTPTPSDYVYFSYTTLATIGYGDFTAASSMGRMIAVSEGLVGQLYLVSAVALLVGNIGRELRRNPIAESDATNVADVEPDRL